MSYKNMNIVSIDDNEGNLFSIEVICNEIGLNVKSFTNPEEAFMYVSNNHVDMILIDYMMPELNGLEFITEYRKKEKIVPIIMVTASGDDEEIHKKAFESGANDFLSKPVRLTLFEARATSLLANYKNTLLLQDRSKLLENEIKKATIKLLDREHETLQILGKTAEYKDPETASHVSRVAHYSKMLAREYGLSLEEQDILFYASPFHDLGKVGIEDKILLKNGKLNEEEFKIMKTHTNIGYEILKDSQSVYLKAGAVIALSHHEKFDGTGYPNGLKGRNIDLYGRIVAVADVFDALTSIRPYKQAWSFDSAINMLKDEKGKHFDPKIVELFINNIDEVREIFESFKDID